MTKEELAEIRERLSKALNNQWCTKEGMVDLVGAALKDSCRLLDEIERLQEIVRYAVAGASIVLEKAGKK